ncbi:MAG: hypothetical protein AAGD28_12280 [Bacteroidota bacterium]
MRLFFLCSILILSSFLLKGQNSFPFPEDIEIVEQPIYPIPEQQIINSGKVLLIQMAYARDQVLNMEDVENALWDQVYSVDLVFTKYPEDTSKWRTNYDVLMRGRLASLHRLDTSLFHKEDIKWRYVLQTECKTEPEAMQYFHGFVLRLEPGRPLEDIPEEIVEEVKVERKPRRPRYIQPSDSLPDFLKEHPEMEEIASIIYGKVGKLKDSSVFRIMRRHPEWKDMLVVMDWTASMYINRATVLNWYRRQTDQDRIKHLVFFNDGNWTPHGGKKIGKTGGIYHSRPYDFDKILRLMYKVRKNGLGGDPAENDIEALLVASRSLSDYQDIIFLPDRNTSIRDLKLLLRLKKPIRILLFRNKKVKQRGVGRNSGKLVANNYIHPHYLTLASFTGGSIHTDTRDLYHLDELKAGDTVRFGRYEYKKQPNGTFRVISR